MSNDYNILINIKEGMGYAFDTRKIKRKEKEN